jgi:hypothetical protein
VCTGNGGALKPVGEHFRFAVEYALCWLMTSFVWIRMALNVACLTIGDSTLVFLETEMTL